MVTQGLSWLVGSIYGQVIYGMRLVFESVLTILVQDAICCQYEWQGVGCFLCQHMKESKTGVSQIKIRDVLCRGLMSMLARFDDPRPLPGGRSWSWAGTWSRVNTNTEEG
jgi:hypothetical protein